MSQMYYLFVFLTVAMEQSVVAQERISAEIGPTFDRLIGPYMGSSKNYRDAGVGYSLSVLTDFRVRDRLFFSAGIGWVTKNIEYKNSGSPTSILQQESYRFVQMPFSMGLKIYDQKLSIESHFGAVANYWLYTVIEGFHPNIFDIDTTSESSAFANTSFKNKQFPNEHNNRMQFGCFLGLRVFYPISTSFSLVLNNRYYYSFSSLEKKSSLSGTYRFNDFSTTIGISKTLK